MDADPKATEANQDGSNTEAKMVPLEALESERRKRKEVENRVAQLEGRIDQLSKSASGASNSQTSKPLTESQIRNAVDNGEITEDQADQIREHQAQQKIASAVEQQVSTRLSSDQIVTRINDYAEAIPELQDQESAAFQKAARCFQTLVADGHKDSNLTKLTALRMAFGNPKAIKREDPEAHNETAGGKGEEGAGDEDWPKGITSRAKAFYKEQMAKGIYTMDQVRAEWGHARDGVADRAAARNAA